MNVSLESIVAEMDTVIAAERRYAALRDLLESRIRQAQVLRRELWRQHAGCLLNAARASLGDTDEATFMVGDAQLTVRRVPERLEVVDEEMAERHARQQPHLSVRCFSGSRFHPLWYLDRAEETYRLSGRLLPGVALIEEHVEIFVNGARVDELDVTLTEQG